MIIYMERTIIFLGNIHYQPERDLVKQTKCGLKYMIRKPITN